jgi:hypothetical protein
MAGVSRFCAPRWSGQPGSRLIRAGVLAGILRAVAGIMARPHMARIIERMDGI